MTVTGVVLAGGTSSRMGVDKAFVPVDGVPMVLRVVSALRAGGCDRIVCQGGDADGLSALGLVVVPDGDGPPGPVRGIATALDAVSGATVIVTAACDLAYLDAASVATTVAACRTSGRVAVAVGADDGRRHLLAAWPASVRPALHEAILGGATTFRGLLDAVGAAVVPVDPATVRNVNRPSDLDDAPHQVPNTDQGDPSVYR